MKERVELAKNEHEKFGILNEMLEGMLDSVNAKIPKEEFKKIDADGGGTISFDEFCDWSITKNLDIDDKQDNADI